MRGVIDRYVPPVARPDNDSTSRTQGRGGPNVGVFNSYDLLGSHSGANDITYQADSSRIQVRRRLRRDASVQATEKLEIFCQFGDRQLSLCFRPRGISRDPQHQSELFGGTEHLAHTVADVDVVGMSVHIVVGCRKI